jgi:hypothetical protein
MRPSEKTLSSKSVSFDLDGLDAKILDADGVENHRISGASGICRCETHRQHE